MIQFANIYLLSLKKRRRIISNLGSVCKTPFPDHKNHAFASVTITKKSELSLSERLLLKQNTGETGKGI